MNVLHEALWISLTVDIWTSRQNAAFMCISRHFIVARMEKLQTKVPSCSHMKKRHTGTNIAAVLKGFLSECKVDKKIISVTTDGRLDAVKGIRDAGMVQIPSLAHR